MGRKQAAILLSLGIFTAVLYLYDIGSPTAYLSIEEVGATRQAISLATTGRSLSGQWLPLYIGEPQYEAGRDPVWIYAQAALLKMRPFSERLIRAPSALAGALDVVLIFVLVRLLLDSDAAAVTAALLLALTPAHFFQSRIATAQIGPLPFLITWLIFLVRAIRCRDDRNLFWACLALGCGVYTYLGAAVTVPVYFVATLCVSYRRRDRSRIDVTPWRYACAGLGLALVPYIAWSVVHPERLRQLTTYYTDNGYNPDVHAKGFSLADALVARADSWWNAFNAERLFFVGDSNLRFSTRRVGYFLWPTAPLLAVGLVRMQQVVSRPLTWVILVGIVGGAIPAVLGGDPEIKRWLSVLVFVVLATVCGAHYVWTTRRRDVRAGVILLACVGVLQFVAFWRDYTGDYRTRSSFYFGGNLRGAVREILANAQDPACVFLDSRLTIAPYWAMYTRAYGRWDFADSGRLVDSERQDFAPEPSCRDANLVVIDKELSNRPEYRDRLLARGWHRTAIHEPDGRVTLSVFHWQPAAAGRR